MSVARFAPPCLVSGVLAGLLGWGVWHVFRPGLIGSDGMNQVHQAWAGGFSDWFPPAMAVALRQLLLLGGSVGTATLLQAVLGALGVWQAARAALRYGFAGAVPHGREAAAALGVLAALLVPPSPLGYFLVFLQNDGWLLVALLWAVVGWLRLLDARLAAAPPGRVGRAGWWVAAAGGSAGVVLVRHNAVVLVPLFAALAWAAAAGRFRYLAAAGVAALPFAVGAAVAWRYPVERVHPEDQVLAVELVGVCVARDELRAELPYTNAHLLEGRFREKYIPGFVNPLYLYAPAESRPTDPNFVGEVVDGVQRLGSRHAELADDYRRAVRVAPLTVAGVKWRAFAGHLTGDHRQPHWHPTDIIPNTLGITLNPGFAPAREWLAAADRAAEGSAVARLVFLNHLPWVVLNVLAVGLAARAARRGNRRAGLGLLVLLVPLGYVLSYLPATAGPQYRYMYPSTLLVQIGTLGAAAGFLLRPRNRPVT
jgi:hypothetical protein